MLSMICTVDGMVGGWIDSVEYEGYGGWHGGWVDRQ